MDLRCSSSSFKRFGWRLVVWDGPLCLMMMQHGISWSFMISKVRGTQGSHSQTFFVQSHGRVPGSILWGPHVGPLSQATAGKVETKSLELVDETGGISDLGSWSHDAVSSLISAKHILPVAGFIQTRSLPRMMIPVHSCSDFLKPPTFLPMLHSSSHSFNAFHPETQLGSNDERPTKVPSMFLLGRMRLRLIHWFIKTHLLLKRWVWSLPPTKAWWNFMGPSGLDVSWNLGQHLFLNMKLGTKKSTGWWFGTCFFLYIYIENNHPNWPSYFSEG
jgi:hypothetical protein